MDTEKKTYTISKLNGTNYASWSYQMRLILLECELFTVIEPGEVEPADANEKLKYLSRQGKALAKIALAICDEQQIHVRHLTSPREVQKELERLYTPRDSKYRIVQLRRKLYSTKLNDYESMEAYLGQINQTVAELANVDNQIEDGDLAMTILCGLPEEWDTVVSTLCNVPEDEFKCTNIKRKILAEAERRKEKWEGKQSAAIMKVNNSQFQHRKEKLPEKGKIDAQREIICFKCQKPGHISKYCRSRTNTSRKHTNAKGMNVVLSNAINDKDAWVIDSGATHHMTPNEKYFAMLKTDTEVENLATADGTTVCVCGKGKIKAKIIEARGSLQEFYADNTLWVPGIKNNILSVTQMIQNGKRVIFDKYGCRICDERNHTLMKAFKKDRLYVVKAEPQITHSGKVAKLQVERSNKLSLDI